MMASLRTSWPLVVALVVSLPGCFGPREDLTVFFVLSPAAPRASDAAPLGQTVGLGPVNLPGYLERSEIVRRQTDNRLDYADTDRWAEPLRENVARVLSRNLLRVLQPDHLVLYPWYATEGVEYGIAVDISRFEADGAGDSVTLEATWSVESVEEEIVVRRSTLIREESEAMGTEGSVAALSRALARLAEEIATTVRELHEDAGA